MKTKKDSPKYLESNVYIIHTMKIRLGFISNSSSTSFVIICENGANIDLKDIDIFINLMGCEPNSPLRPFYERIHEIIFDFRSTGPVQRNYLTPFLKDTYKENYRIHDELWKQLQKAFASGAEIRFGEFSTEDGIISCIMSNDIVVAENGGFKFYGLNNSF